MIPEDEYVMLSALQHYVFCPRQCALIHVEQVWEENEKTVSGNLMHERVHEDGHETRKDVRIVRALRLNSKELGITGVADVVEFHRLDASNEPDLQTIGVSFEYAEGLWCPFPVEYKHGKPKHDQSDEIQLCGQALCLEEMLHVKIRYGALFYGKTRKRRDVCFDEDLRAKCLQTIAAVRNLIRDGMTPPPNYGRWCESCSLIELCRPRNFSSSVSAKSWIENQIKMSEEGE